MQKGLFTTTLDLYRVITSLCLMFIEKCLRWNSENKLSVIPEVLHIYFFIVSRTPSVFSLLIMKDELNTWVVSLSLLKIRFRF